MTSDSVQGKNRRSGKRRVLITEAKTPNLGFKRPSSSKVAADRQEWPPLPYLTVVIQSYHPRPGTKRITMGAL